MIKKQLKGETPIIWVVGDNHKQAKEFYYWFWHYGIAETNLESERLSWHSDNVVSFYTTKEKFLRGATLARLFFLIDNEGERFKGVKGGAMSEARQWAIDYWNKTETTTGYVVKRGKFNYHDYDSNHGRAENLSDIDA